MLKSFAVEMLNILYVCNVTTSASMALKL